MSDQSRELTEVLTKIREENRDRLFQKVPELRKYADLVASLVDPVSDVDVMGISFEIISCDTVNGSSRNVLLRNGKCLGEVEDLDPKDRPEQAGEEMVVAWGEERLPLLDKLFSIRRQQISEADGNKTAEDLAAENALTDVVEREIHDAGDAIAEAGRVGTSVEVGDRRYYVLEGAGRRRLVREGVRGGYAYIGVPGPENDGTETVIFAGQETSAVPARRIESKDDLERICQAFLEQAREQNRQLDGADSDDQSPSTRKPLAIQELKAETTRIGRLRAQINEDADRLAAVVIPDLTVKVDGQEFVVLNGPDGPKLLTRDQGDLVYLGSRPERENPVITLVPAPQYSTTSYGPAGGRVYERGLSIVAVADEFKAAMQMEATGDKTTKAQVAARLEELERLAGTGKDSGDLFELKAMRFQQATQTIAEALAAMPEPFTDPVEVDGQNYGLITYLGQPFLASYPLYFGRAGSDANSIEVDGKELFLATAPDIEQLNPDVVAIADALADGAELAATDGSAEILEAVQRIKKAGRDLGITSTDPLERATEIAGASPKTGVVYEAGGLLRTRRYLVESTERGDFLFVQRGDETRVFADSGKELPNGGYVDPANATDVKQYQRDEPRIAKSVAALA